MPCLQGAVFGGIDAHKDLHMPALVDEAGAVVAAPLRGPAVTGGWLGAPGSRGGV